MFYATFMECFISVFSPCHKHRIIHWLFSVLLPRPGVLLLSGNDRGK